MNQDYSVVGRGELQGTPPDRLGCSSPVTGLCLLKTLWSGELEIPLKCVTNTATVSLCCFCGGFTTSLWVVSN